MDLDLSEIQGRRVTLAEYVAGEDYVVLRFDDGSTLYANNPAYYGAIHYTSPFTGETTTHSRVER